tara:strand:- start:358 stop:1950 length:1593 start_codon:yes stop_codon:yes gene_type:complete
MEKKLIKIRSKENTVINNVIFDLILIYFCITPVWLFSKLGVYEIFIISISVLLTFFIFLLITKIKKKNSLFFISIIFFYGLDSKLGLWSIFETQIDSGLVRYLLSIIFSSLIIIFIFKIINKDVLKFKKIFSFMIVLLFSINWLFDYNFHSKNKKIETLTLENKIIQKDKTIILLLDEMIGHDGINEKIKYGKLAKKSYTNLSKKFDFKLYSSAYTIFDESIHSIPALLNFDHQTYKNNSKNYYFESVFDKKTKWIIKKNKFFEQNKEKKIITNKNQAISYCSNIPNECIVSDAINNSNIYLDNFNFSKKDYFFKKMHNQKSITFQIIWRVLYEKKLINDYHYLTFNKVKFDNDLKNLGQIINNTNYDIYFFHLLFPHRPFTFELKFDENKCFFNEKYLDNSLFEDERKTLEQHYKEIICTNNYLSKFLDTLSVNFNTNHNYKIILMSDTGLKQKEEIKDQLSMKNHHSVFFAVKQKNKKFEIDENFKSSQELFSNYLNKENQYKQNDQLIHKVYSTIDNKFIKIKKFNN